MATERDAEAVQQQQRVQTLLNDRTTLELKLNSISNQLQSEKAESNRNVLLSTAARSHYHFFG